MIDKVAQDISILRVLEEKGRACDRRGRIVILLMALFFLVAGTRVALAHITPQVVLMSDREAVVRMMPRATRFFTREVTLAPEERHRIENEWKWKPTQDVYQFYLGRDKQGRFVGAVIFLMESTIHGPVRVAVGIRPDGRVQDAQVLELTNEAYYWVKPLLDQNFTQEYVGLDSRASFIPSGRFSQANLQSMPYFYARIVASLIQRGAILSEVTLLKAEGAA